MIRQVDRYELLEQVGTGGMAVVYRGRDTALDREVAVKLLHPHLAARAEARARFAREARAVARLAHPNILEIYDYAEEAEESFLVTEFVHGRTLRAFAEAVGFGYPEIGMLVGRALADALVHAHSAGVIHRDIKPENVLVCEVEGRRSVKLADFGIARILASDERMTMTGALVGSPNHMAPEIIEGGEADPRSDIFSLGTLLYWLATGELPFAASNPTATLRRVAAGEYRDPRLASPLVSDALAETIRRTLQVNPAARYASAGELRDALDGVLAEARLTRPEEELSAFLGAPAEYKSAFPKRLVEALLARGRAAKRDKSVARALACYNRVLVVDPENSAVISELDRLARYTRIRRWAARAGLGLAAAALLVGAGAVRQYLRSERRLPIGPPPAATAAVPPAAPRSPPAPAPRAEVAPRKPSAGPEPPGPKPRRHAPVEFAVHVRPYAQRALLDGVEVARGAQRVTFVLEPGRTHLLQIEHACCVPFTKKIGAEEASRLGELKVPLVPRPARLRVAAHPETRIYLGGRFIGTAGESQRSPIAVPVPESSDSPYEGSAELRLERPGSPPYTASVALRAGGEITVAAPSTEAAP